MEKIYQVKIVDIEPGTLDMGIKDKIIDAYVKVEVGGIKFWCFVYEWRTRKWSLSMKGKTVPLKFIFLNIPAVKTEISDKRRKEIVPVPNQKKPCDYIIMGEIVNKEPSPTLPDKYERLQVDCGFIANNLSVEKDKYKIGDYIQAEGRLDAHKVDEKEGYE
jgi:hypothetical protein